MTREYKIIAAIADLHIGVRHISAEVLKAQLKKHFFKPLEKIAALDGIFVLGDVTHTILSLNSGYSNLFHWFIDRLYRLARKRNAVVVIVKGTISHDNDQLNNIRSYMDNEDGVDFRVYDRVQETTLWGDYRTLILPDVKVKNGKEIEAFLDSSEKYDLILGHGLIDRMRFFSQESENAPMKSYVYPVEKLLAACRGPVLFGHVHQYQSYRKKFHYVGPFTMLERGGTGAGFVIAGIFDQDRTRFKVEHYENPDSASYLDLEVTVEILRSVPMDDLIAAIDDLAEKAKPNDLFTLRIIREGEAESTDKVAILENRYRRDGRFSIVKTVLGKEEEERNRNYLERKKRYAYCMDESMPIPEIFYTYYIHDVKPTLPTQSGPLASLTEEDFWRALDMERAKEE